MDQSILIALVLLVFCQFAAALMLAFLVKRALDRLRSDVESKISAAITDLVEQPEPDQPSKLAQLADLIGACVGSAAARSIMASLNADKSHAARAANGAADVLEAQANPLLALLAGSKRGKGAALMRLAQQLGPMLTGKGTGVQLPLASGSNHGSGPGDIADRISRQSGA